MTCRYTFDTPNGPITLEGKPALKAYLASGDNLARLLPDRAASAFKAVAPSMEQGTMVRDTASSLAKAWKNPPKIVVFSDMSDPAIPPKVRAADQKQRSGGATGEPEGFFYQGTVYLSGKLKSTADVTRVLFHEGLGHYGLRGVYGSALKPVLDQIVALRKGDVLAKAKQYGLDAANQDDLLQAAEEVLSDMAQTRPELGFVKRALAAIRTWLRQNVPGMGNLELSDAEIIRDYLIPARTFVESGAQSGRDMAEAAFSRAPAVQSDAFKRWFGDSKVVDENGNPLVVYHGGTFDESKDGIPRTEGANKKGWQLSFGMHFSEDKTEAEAYVPVKKGRLTEAYVSLKNPLNLIPEYDAENDRKVFHPMDKAFYEAMPVKLKKAYDKLYSRAFEVGNYGYIEWLDQTLDMLKAAEAKKAIQEMGFDGVVYTARANTGSGRYRPFKAYIAFNPEQIKSATGNSGEFNPQNPDIRFSRSTPQPTGLTLPEQGLLRRLQASLQDNFNRVRQVQERIAKMTGQPVSEYANYYGAETQRPGRIAARLEDFERGMTAPLMAKLAKSGHTMEQISELLHAMHAEERNEAVAKINPDMPDGGSGMTTADAKKILSKYRTNATLHALADDAREIARATLDLKLAYGLIDADTYATLDVMYENYVPLKGDGEYGPKIKRAMGHEEREEFIIQNIARDYQQAVVAGEKNLARQSLAQLVLENPDPKLWTVGIPPRGRYVAGTVFSVRNGGKEIATFTSKSQVSAFLEGVGPQAAQFEVYAGGERVREFVRPLQDNEVPVYINGQLVRMQIVGDEQLASQLRPLNQGQMHPILEMMRVMNRHLARVYTGYNPAFIIRNMARDAMTGSINMIGNEGSGIAAKAWVNYPAAMKALFAYAATGKVPSGEAGVMLDEYRQNGGKTGASWMSDLEQQGKTLQRLFDDAYGATGYLKDKNYGKAASVAGRKIVGGMAHTIEVLNQATENSLRLALYMAMRKDGRSAGEAAQAAKSVTVDFDRKGTLSPALGAIYLFFNPAVQGTANAIKTLVKGKHRAQAWTTLGVLAALGFYMASQGMDDDEDRWLGESWETRSKNMLMNIGGSHISVPVSMEFAPFYAAGVAVAEAKKTGSMTAAAHLVSSFLNAYFPLQGVYSEESENHMLDAVGAGIPTILKPYFQIATNRNSFGTQLMPDNEFTKNRPDNLKMSRSTKGSPFEAVAQGIASVGESKLGAGRYENDISKVSPETLKFLWHTYTGGLGQFVTDLGALGNVAAKDAKVETTDVPIVKDFVKANDVKAIRGRYNHLAKEVQAASEEFRQAQKAGDGEAQDAILSNPSKAQLISFDRMMKSTSKAAAELKDAMVDVNADTKLTLAEKRAKLKELEREEEALYRNAIAAFRD